MFDIVVVFAPEQPEQSWAVQNVLKQTPYTWHVLGPAPGGTIDAGYLRRWLTGKLGHHTTVIVLNNGTRPDLAAQLSTQLADIRAAGGPWAGNGLQYDYLTCLSYLRTIGAARSQPAPPPADAVIFTTSSYGKTILHRLRAAARGFARPRIIDISEGVSDRDAIIDGNWTEDARIVVIGKTKHVVTREKLRALPTTSMRPWTGTFHEFLGRLKRE